MIITHTVSTASRELLLTRTVDAPREVVFEAWVDPEQVREWMVPKGHRVESLEADVRPDGKWRMSLVGPAENELRQRGSYRDVVDQERLVFTLVWDEPGRRSHETTVHVTFFAKGPKTLVTFQQGVFASEAERDAHAGVWSEIFDRLQEFLRGTRTRP